MSHVFRAHYRVASAGSVPVLRMNITIQLPPDVDCSDARLVRSHIARHIAKRWPPPMRVEIDRIVRLESPPR
ncbi:MAG: hypothetical protein HUK09_02605 [Bacteroidaceae bacterium]|nr:hypothetical protein [Bacteroidaceae bacterium]